MSGDCCGLLTAFRLGVLSLLEQPDISRAIVAGANSVGFAVESQTVEVVGLCGTCRDQKDA